MLARATAGSSQKERAHMCGGIAIDLARTIDDPSPSIELEIKLAGRRHCCRDLELALHRACVQMRAVKMGTGRVDPSGS